MPQSRKAPDGSRCDVADIPAGRLGSCSGYNAGSSLTPKLSCKGVNNGAHSALPKCPWQVQRLVSARMYDGRYRHPDDGRPFGRPENPGSGPHTRVPSNPRTRSRFGPTGAAALCLPRPSAATRAGALRGRLSIGAGRGEPIGRPAPPILRHGLRALTPQLSCEPRRAVTECLVEVTAGAIPDAPPARQLQRHVRPQR
jgi:hypothetical protein